MVCFFVSTLGSYVQPQNFLWVLVVVDRHWFNLISDDCYVLPIKYLFHMSGFLVSVKRGGCHVMSSVTCHICAFALFSIVCNFCRSIKNIIYLLRSKHLFLRLIL